MGEKGIAMLSVILVLLITIVLLNGLMAMTLTEVRISLNDQYGTQALYLAEAGNELALDYLYNNPNFRGELLTRSSFDNPIFLGGGRINSIIVQNNPPNVRITSEGEVDGVIRRVALLIRISLIQNEEGNGEVTEVFIDKLRWQFAF